MAYSTLVDRHPRLRLGCQTSTRVENASFQTRYRIYYYLFIFFQGHVLILFVLVRIQSHC
jgi:hypothetical protein